ncbi:MAG: hypothetical protein Q9162_005781 [Coniocarpon cinnabarinum]
MSAPTLINLPPPPSDPVTPSDIPGTPNSATTSMSELSTVAIKDGHRGHPHHHSHRQPQSAADGADAERADRISRLAGLERVSTVRQSSTASTPAGTSTTSQGPGYFEPPTAPANTNKERSTVGSASATGSVGGRTTWASGSDAFDNTTDKMSEDQDMDASSTGGFSDEGNASLVGFGEAASSTVSGPVSTTAARATHRGSLQPPRSSGMAAPPSRDSTTVPMQGLSPPTPRQDARMIDGMTTDSSVVDSAYHGPRAVGNDGDAERIMSDHMDISSEGGMSAPGVRHDGQKELGKFGFEDGGQ